MTARRIAPSAPAGRCVAPTGAVADSLEATPLCGAEATETRVVDGVALRLCLRHAREYDADIAAERRGAS